MSRYIDAEALPYSEVVIDEYGLVNTYHTVVFAEHIDNIPTADVIPKTEYEARLKADMVAMLTELQSEIEELDNPLDYDFEGYNQCAVDCEKIIQQKIDSLKGRIK